MSRPGTAAAAFWAAVFWTGVAVLVTVAAVVLLLL